MRVYVISTKRPGNVERMQALIGPLFEVVWLVGVGEHATYTTAGARFVEEAGGLCPARNVALQRARERGEFCIQLSDDLRALKIALGPKEKEPITFFEAIGLILQDMLVTGAKLAGVAPTANAFFFNPKTPVHSSAFIVGDFIVVDMSCGLFFDEKLRLKEDYDYTLQHLKQHGGVVRVNCILAEFLHRTNKGGAVDFRTAEREQEAIAYLKAKWPGLIKDNSKRPNEILLNLK